MKKFSFLAGFAIIMHGAFAQCPFTVTLKTTGYCLGDTLTVSTSTPISQIVWYKGATVDTTVRVRDLGNIGVTVAGRDGSGSDPDHFDGPYGIYVDAFGNVYVADSFNGRIQKWAPGASSGVTVAGGQGLGAAPDQLSAPFGVFVEGSGNLYVVDAGNNRVQKFPPGSTSMTNGLTVAGIGNGLPGSGAGQLNNPLGIFVDGGGNLYIADYGNSRVQKWTPGAVAGITVAGGHGKGTAVNQVSCPTSVFVDHNGNLFVADACSNRVQEWSPGADSGVNVAGGNGEGPGADQLRAPYGVFVDANGVIYVSDYGNSRVQKIVHEFSIDTTDVPTAPGLYKAVVTNGAGCEATTEAVVMNPRIISAVSVGSSAAVVCTDSPVTFSAIPTNGGVAPSFQWQVNGNKLGPNSPIFIDDSLKDGDQVSNVLTSDMACTSPVQSNIVAIVVKPSPSVYAGRDTVIAPGKTVQLDPSATGNIIGYQWTPVTALDDPTVPKPIAAPVVSTSYQLTVVGENGCTASGKINIMVYYALRMPGAFTPNGDGKNDLFRVPPLTPQKIIHFSVYNRSGSRVFMTRNGSEGWDGNFNGQRQPAGAYVWDIEYYDLLTGRPLRAAGTVALIR